MSFPRYERYKESGVEVLGDAPAHWAITKLKRVVDASRPITYGIVQAGPHVEGGVPYIRPADMAAESGVASEADLLRTTQAIADAYKRSEIRCGDIVCSIGPSFGKVMVTPPSLDGANLTQGTARVAIAEPNCTRFFFWVLRSSPSFAQWDSSIGGATFRALNLEPLAETVVVRPSPQEQVSIAAFLDRETTKIDALVEEQKRLIEMLKEKRQAVISHAVTKGLDPNAPMKDSGVEWLGQVPEHWEVAPLYRATALLQTGPFGSQLHSDDYVADGIPVINPANIREGRLISDDTKTVSLETAQRLSAYRIVPGDIVIGRRGEMGRCAVASSENDGWLCGTGSLLVRLNDLTVPAFLAASFDTQGVREALTLSSVGSTMDNLSETILGRLPQPLPPAAEQVAIVRYIEREVAALRALMDQAGNAIALLQERRTALISAAVTGKIDVRSAAAKPAEAA